MNGIVFFLSVVFNFMSILNGVALASYIRHLNEKNVVKILQLTKNE